MKNFRNYEGDGKYKMNISEVRSTYLVSRVRLDQHYLEKFRNFSSKKTTLDRTLNK